MRPLSQGDELPLLAPARWTSSLESAISYRFWTDAFRAFASVVIVFASVHYAMHAPADAAALPQQALGHDLSSLLASGLGRVSPSSRWLLAAGLASAIVLGPAPRIAAASLAAVLASRPPVATPDAAFDVPMMSLIAVLLVMLPASARSGTGWWAVSAFRRSTASSSRYARWTVELCVCALGVVYANVFCWRRAFSHWDAQPLPALIVAGIVSLSLFASKPRWLWTAMALQVGLHLALAAAWGHPVGNLLLASTALLQLARTTSSAEPALVDASVACAMTMICVFVLFIAAQILGSGVLVQTTGAALSNLGPLVGLYGLD